VNKANTTTTLTSSQNPSIYQNTVILTATVSLAASTGTVTFMDGSTTLSTSTLINGRATYITSALTLGSHPITASYGGDTNCNGSTSSTLVQTINLPGTTTTLASSPNPSIYMTSVTFTATVSPAAATGTVTFNDGATTLGTVSLISGVATYSTAALTLGSPPDITASYSGDTNYGSSTSAILMQTVNNLSTETVLTSSLNPSTYQTPVTFTATVSPVAATGTVTFKDGTTTLSTRTLSGGQAMYTTSSLASGLHLITAVYNGNSNYSGSTSSALTQTVGTITGIEVTPADLTLPVNSRQRFQAKVTYSDGSTQDATTYSAWSSSNASVGTIDATGILTAVSQGQTTVQATISSATGSTTLTIQGRSFVPAGHVSQYRRAHTATLLPNGTVLIAGGFGGYVNSGNWDVLNSAEIYDPATKALATTGGLNTPRAGHTATLLPNGKVLIVGGETPIGNTGYFQDLTSAELYDPATGVFTPTGNLSNARYAHTATLLPNGNVLIVGGYVEEGFGSEASAELYDPATGTFTPTGSLSVARGGGSATLLNDGTVLVVGGASGFDIWDTSEIYDPASGVFSAGPSLPTTLNGQSAILLNNGKVLIAGGTTNWISSTVLSSMMLYDPATRTFSSAASLAVARMSPTFTLLDNGSVLIVGGDSTSESKPYNTAELYDPSNQIFIGAGATANPYLCYGCFDYPGLPDHTATLLNDETVLIVGGIVSGVVERYGLAFPVPTTLQISPASASIRTGDTQQFMVVDNTGQQRFDAIWTVSNTNVVTIPSDSLPIVTAINPGYATIAANVDGEIAQAQITVKPYSLRITPASATMVVGEKRQFRIVDERGLPCTVGSWTVSNEALATITNNSSPTLTALAPGTVTITAIIGDVSAQAQVTIYPSVADIPSGTPFWSAPTMPGFSSLQSVQAQVIGDVPYLYSISLRSDGNQSIVQALTPDGQQTWQSVLPGANANSVPDNFGGLLVTVNQTCKEGQTVPMRILDLDPKTGQPLWEIAAQPLPLGDENIYCYLEAPQFAIRPEGNIIIATPGNLSGLPELMLVNGTTGQITNIFNIPLSSMKDVFGRIVDSFSLIGPPVVDSEGTAYVEYEVRNIDYPAKILSAELWLKKIAMDGSSADILLSSTTENKNIFPGRIIPDGEGGVVATWYVAQYYPPGLPPDPPIYPYYAAHVVSGGIVSPYGLPFQVNDVVYGKYLSLVLGENGTAYATDSTNSDYGPKIISFNLSSGAINWEFQTSDQNRLALIASSDGNGLVAKVTDQTGGDTVMRFDSAGSVSFDSGTASFSNLDFFVATGSWIGTPLAGNNLQATYTFAPLQLSTSSYAQTSGTGANAANVKMWVLFPSHSGPNQTVITDQLNRIKRALPLYRGCDNWLKGPGISGYYYLRNYLLPNNWYGHGIFATDLSDLDYGTAAFWGWNWPGLGLILYLDNTYRFNVNDLDGFFNDVDNRNNRFKTGSPSNYYHLPDPRKLRELIVIHELAHGIENPVFMKENGNRNLTSFNDALVYCNCGGLIEGPDIDYLLPVEGSAGTPVTIWATDRGAWGRQNITDPFPSWILLENFGEGSVDSEVYFNGAPIAINPGDWHDGFINFIVPAGIAPGATVEVVVKVAGVASRNKYFKVK
jgi:hypothetical protein